MRQFSEFEKDVLKEIVSEKPLLYEYNGAKYVSNSLGKIMVERLNVIHISQIEEDQIKIVFVDKERDDEVSLLFDFIFFIKFLEDNYLLGLSSLGHKTEFTSSRYEYKARELLGMSFPEAWYRMDKEKEVHPVTVEHTHRTMLGKEILRYIHSSYYPSHELKHLVANGFKSDEQIYVEEQLYKAKKQTIFAFWTMLVAILTLVVTVIIPLVSK